jgi:protoheme IX farnesyltransferase
MTASSVSRPLAATTLFGDFWQLAKPRIALMVVVTAAAGFLLDARVPFDWSLFLHAMAGTALLAAGAGTLNQWWERDVDRGMARTAQRPLPAGRLSADLALWFGVALNLAGLAWLTLAVNALTALLGACTLIGYVLIYTPAKRWSSLATILGGVPGAIPPMMGWAAAHGQLGAGAWALFGILFFWQIPHFLAIAWMYRDDYRAAGFPMLTDGDESGRRTARQALLYCAALTPLSLVPAALRLAGPIYALGALVLGFSFFAICVGFYLDRSRASARRVLLASVLYLPALLPLLLLNRVVS